jgi:hypothetical protein
MDGVAMTPTASELTTGTDSAGAADAPPPAAWRRVASAIGHRWPTWLALAVAAVSLWDVGDGSEFTFMLFAAAMVYLLTAVLDRPRATWPVLFAAMAAIGALRLLDIDPWTTLAAVAVALVAVGLARGQLRRRGLHVLQAPVALGLIAVGMAALSAPLDIGRHLVAAALLGHAAWDAAHWRANKIVKRSFAEWCAVLDLVVGLGIVILPVVAP